MSRSPHLPLDAFAQTCIDRAPHCIVAWYLMASYLYYQTDESLLTDEYFDALCRRLDERWGTIRHPHKHLIDRGMLEAGTGYHLRLSDYPAITISAAILLTEEGPAGNSDYATALEDADVEPPPHPASIAHPQQGDLFG